jgi:hypothetical protein
VYKVYKTNRTDTALYYSVRQTRLPSGRRCGTVFVSEHTHLWAEFTMPLGTLYETALFVEAGGAAGWIDFLHIAVTADTNGAKDPGDGKSKAKGKTKTIVVSVVASVGGVVVLGVAAVVIIIMMRKLGGSNSSTDLNQKHDITDNDGDNTSITPGSVVCSLVCSSARLFVCLFVRSFVPSLVPCSRSLFCFFLLLLLFYSKVSRRPRTSSLRLHTILKWDPWRTEVCVCVCVSDCMWGRTLLIVRNTPYACLFSLDQILRQRQKALQGGADV